METGAREIVWIKAARKAFSKFPLQAQDRINTALRIAAVGQKADITKPMKGLGSGIFEIALAYRSDAFRTIYAVNIGDQWSSSMRSRRNRRVASRRLKARLIWFVTE